ncbi:MAG: CDP-diacylglycerol--serine O-phosphatidyltransferase [Cetobacterium sp.]|uniref:CDP-diacylglycerol--serine O-phosphatidyltransferase n=1 Tax=Cetobacterium ceti TaxID=180163 RepID=A0A1T4JVF5_9FUSO|nr:CDP-diacylglycerol--serine O-phosphatidyltransferase [Cetobacterium ceti]MCJ8342150.1 CDP-diacylglycerol--serine O-phosphatidyltransferase [Cetobacterium sp.]SJZ34114.1 CDP-diacylglycerol--serine O-phosphatidyltransferase [Cetobacterium ceti]
MVEKKYIAPNAITAANMFLGYLSITASINGDFTKAVWFVILAMVCDGLDGKTARKLDAFSEFGKEFDSFCDAISFGLAPAILVYSVLKNNMDVTSFIIPVSFIYALCGVMRLVKFNIVTVASSEKDDFSGMPIPSGAAIVCGYYMISYYMNTNFGINIFSTELFMGITVIAAILMVSTVPFQTPDKSFNFIPKKLMIPFVILVIATLKYSLFIFTCFYVLKNVFKFFSGRLQGN